MVKRTAGTINEGSGAPGGIRTPDQWLRKPLLYPAELRARGVQRAGMGDPKGARQSGGEV
jgi:hypothetical protein